MKSYRLAFALSVIGVVMLAVGCSSNENKTASETPAAAAKKAEPSLYSGEEAFNRMLGLALKWAADAEPARVESVLNTEATGQGGKSTVWRGHRPRRKINRLARVFCLAQPPLH
ncbi:exported hypothetical protein [Candidatus Sulfotelmatobacter sp. SbA7]|nr:exported hypothetical protein [Candidatus Sulfotelmatobacter sp. SbA7]